MYAEPSYVKANKVNTREVKAGECGEGNPGAPTREPPPGTFQRHANRTLNGRRARARSRCGPFSTALDFRRRGGAPYLLSKMGMTQPQLRTNETQLIKRVCEGEREAFYDLLRPYEGLIYATAISILKNPADAEEIAQEAVLKAFLNLATFRAEARFSTWLVQITYNEARMKLRKARPHLYESIDDQQETDERDYFPRDFADWRPIPSELIEDQEMRQQLQKAIDSLSPSYREVLILRDLQDLSVKETTMILGLSEASVKTRLHRARLILRDTLAPGIDGGWIKGQGYRKVRPW